VSGQDFSNGMYKGHAAGILRRKCEFNPMNNDRIPSLTEIPRRREIDKKPDSLVRQRGSLRAQIAFQQRSGSPDVAKIAAYQRRIQELEAMMDRLLNSSCDAMSRPGELNTVFSAMLGNALRICGAKFEKMLAT
jgi:hypothetical protein